MDLITVRGFMDELPDVPSETAENRDTENEDATENSFGSYEEAFGDLPCPVFYVDDSSTMQLFSSFGQIKKYITKHEQSHQANCHTNKAGHRDQYTQITSLPFQSLAHFTTLGEYMRYLYESHRLTDVQIEVDGHTFYAHMSVLCCFSGYFSDLLFARKATTIPVEVKLLGLNAEAFGAFLEFIYTGNVTVQPATEADLFIIAEFLNVQMLRRRLGSVQKHLSVSQAVRILARYRKCCPETLFTTLVAKVTREFPRALLVPDFLDLNVNTLCLILSSDDLMTPREFEVFRVALRWIMHGVHERLIHVSRVMRLVRFNQMCAGELVSCVEETDLFRQHVELRDLVLVANWINTVVELGRRDPFLFPVSGPRARNIRQSVQKKVENRSKGADAIYSVMRMGTVTPTVCTAIPQAPQAPVYIPQALQAPVYIPQAPQAPVYIPQAPQAPVSISQAPQAPVYIPQTPQAPVSISQAPQAPVSIPQAPQAPVSIPQAPQAPVSTPQEPQAPVSFPQAPQAPVSIPQAPQAPVSTPQEPQAPVSIPQSPQAPVSFPQAPQAPVSIPQEPQAPVSIPQAPQAPVSTPQEPQAPVSIPQAPHSIPQAPHFLAYWPLEGHCGKPVLLPTEVTPRTSPTEPFIKFDLYVLGGFQHNSERDDSLDDARSPWVRFCNLPSPRRRHAVALLKNRIFLIGGCDPTGLIKRQPLKSVFAMKVATPTWDHLADMGDARMDHCACVAGNSIYVFGGIGVNERLLSTAECYHPETNTWTYVALMTSPRFAAMAAAVGGKCYVAGGLNGIQRDSDSEVVDLLECYDPKTNTWSMKRNLRRPRCHGNLVNVDGKMYLCGGATFRTRSQDTRDGLHSVYAIDVYFPATDTWLHEADLRVGRHEAGVAVAGSRIYIIGGISSLSAGTLRSVECYDTADRRWLEDVGSLPVPARGIRCVALQTALT